MGQMLRLVSLAIVLPWLLSALTLQAHAAGKCDDINVQTSAENRWRDGSLSKRAVAIFFAGTKANALSESEKQKVEVELNRFFLAFQRLYSPTAYFWNADPDLVREEQARFDYLVVIDAELNKGPLPKYNEQLSSLKGKPIDEDQLAIADYPVSQGSSPSAAPPYAFVQIADIGPRDAYVMFAEWLLLVLGADLSVHVDPEYYARLSGYVAGDAYTATTVDSLERTYEMIVYDCLAPVFQK